MRILELSNYSAGVCGVWVRVREEAARLRERGHDVMIFSSNLTKGNDEIAPSEGDILGVPIKRFPARKLGGESYMRWDFEKEALNFKPDVIIAHVYRHPHTLNALKVADKLKKKGQECRVFLVSHAPFERSSTRSFIEKASVWAYDKFIGKRTINKFDRIIAIAKWEIPYLIKIGADKKRIRHIPNGAPEEFFGAAEESKAENKILFFGRVSPIKNIETAISAMPLVKNKKAVLEIAGPAEEDYLARLKALAGKLGVEGRVFFSPPVYDTTLKIRKIDSAKVFVLPSKSEAFSIALIEAMARGRVVIASATEGAKEIIKNGKTGFIFKIDDSKALAKKIDFALDRNNAGKIGRMRRNAVKYAGAFSWSRIVGKLEREINAK